MSTSELESLEQTAAARAERLRILKGTQEGDTDQNYNKSDSTDDKSIAVKFRNYVPHDKALEGARIAPPELIQFQDPIASAPPPSEKEDPFLNIAPKKPNWDLRKDAQKKLEKLERRTQKALYQLMELQEKEKLVLDDNAEV